MTSDTRTAGAPADEAGAPPAVAVEGITKTYGAVTAVQDIDLTLRRGTVHGLVGENGSGKSTLTKIIAGVVAPDEGTVTIDGHTLGYANPRSAISLGVRVIFQDLALFPNMTVAENLVFGGDEGLLGRISKRHTRERARVALDALHLKIDPHARLGELSIAERQLVAIARTVSSNGRIILMDEPTAALTHEEIEELLATVRRLSQQGLSFIFISHKLREVVSVADEVTVIRDGRLISSGPSSEYDQERITELMTGGAVQHTARSAAAVAEQAEPVVEVRGMTLAQSFHDVDLRLFPGRVLGLAGLVGSGRSEIGLAIAGLVKPESGEIRFQGAVQRDLHSNPSLQYVPEDRLTEGLYLDWSIADNIVANDLDEVSGRAGTVSTQQIIEVGERWRDDLRIKAPTVMDPASSLSGGNQQRVLLARALASGPDVIILNNPTVGVDIGSRAEIHNLIRATADGGTSLLLISDESAELLSVCDDIAIVREGRITTQHESRSLSEDTLLDLISEGGTS